MSALENKAVVPLSISRSSRSLRFSPQLGQLPPVLVGLATLVAGPSATLGLLDHSRTAVSVKSKSLATWLRGPVSPLAQPTISALNSGAKEQPPRVLPPSSPWSDVVPLASP
jgi:hypothetical protein